MGDFVFDGTWEGWKRAARLALAAESTPDDTRWTEEAVAPAELFSDPPGVTVPPTATTPPIRVSRAFINLAEEASHHSDPSRWSLLYRMLWRMQHDAPHLPQDPTDPDMRDLHLLARAVRRDMHKMRAFVRFREVRGDDGAAAYVAWFEPRHHIVEANAPFFRDRFASMRWSILTPDRCAHWDMRVLSFTPGVARSAAPSEDAMEDLWRTYYASIFNPARVKVSAMTREMPRYYWQHLPEARAIRDLVVSAQPRADAMIARSQRQAARATQLGEFSHPLIPAHADLPALRTAAAKCQACPLWKDATCAVFGEGPERAGIVVVGEQPGDQEDRAGRPFVGPAGHLLDRALAAAGIPRVSLYLTNAVKHFKWTPQGQRRLHQKPNAREIAACRPWLAAELGVIRPRLIVCLGATAAQAVVGRPVRVLSERALKLDTEFGAPALITVHPSSLLRLAAGADHAAEFEKFVADLRLMQE